MPKPKFDLQMWLREMEGVEIEEMDPQDPNTAFVREVAPEPQQGGSILQGTRQMPGEAVRRKVDINRVVRDFMETEGVERDQFDVEASSPEAPLQRGLSFVDQVKISFSGKPSDKVKALKTIDPNVKVRVNPKTKGLVIQGEDGQWREAESSALAGLVAESPITAASIAGGAKLAGAVPGPPQVKLAAGLLGAGLSAMAAKWGTIEAAEAAGLREEQDGQEMLQEIGNEGLFALGGEAAGPLLKFTAKGALKGVNKAVQKISNKTQASKNAVAETMSQFNGLDPLDNFTWLEQGDRVKPFQKETLDWLAKGGKTKGLPHPVMGKIKNDIVELTTSFKNQMYKQMDDEVFNRAGINLDKTMIEVDDVLGGIENELRAARLLDEGGNFVRPKDIGLGGAGDIAASKNVNQVRKAYTVVKNVLTENAERVSTGAARPGQMSLREVRQLERNLGELVDAAGGFRNLGPVEITEAGIAKVYSMRGALRDRIGRDLSKRGNKFADAYNDINAKFSDGSRTLESVSKNIREDKLEPFVDRVFSAKPDRGFEIGQLKAMAEGLGRNGENWVQSQFIKKAGMNSTKLFPERGAIGTVKGLLGMGPRTSAPLTGRTFTSLRTKAAATEALSKMPQHQLDALLGDEQSLRMINQVLAQANQGSEEMADQLTLEAINRIQGR